VSHGNVTLLLLFLTLSCSEGILWHVLTTPIKISQTMLTKYEEAVGDVYCPERTTMPSSELEEGIKPVFKLPPKDKRTSGGTWIPSMHVKQP